MPLVLQIALGIILAPVLVIALAFLCACVLFTANRIKIAGEFSLFLIRDLSAMPIQIWRSRRLIWQTFYSDGLSGLFSLQLPSDK